MNVDLKKHLKELEEDGVTVIPQVFSHQDMIKYKTALMPIVEKVEKTLKTTGKPRIFHNDGKKTETRYWQLGQHIILQAGPGRFDTRYGLDQGVFADNLLQHNPIIEALVKTLLHNRYVNHTGVVYSAPGSGDQYWHRDTDNIADTDSNGTQLSQMDDFYFTVLVPLVPMNKENGTTEFMLGTHRKAAHDFDNSPTVQYDVALGDVLMFNGKMNHRGRANQSTEARPVIYNVYYKGWYNDSYREGVS